MHNDLPEKLHYMQTGHFSLWFHSYLWDH